MEAPIEAPFGSYDSHYINFQQHRDGIYSETNWGRLEPTSSDVQKFDI